MNSTEPTILVHRTNNLTTITLNRPRALNAINLEMVDLMIDALKTAQTDGTKLIVITGNGERGLSGGGDIKEMASNNASQAHVFINREYQLDLMIAQSKIPVIGIMAGITMGGGIGLTGHAALRIVTENSRLAMPETRIGIMPDVGGNHLLAKSPGRIGEYLALSATSMNAADAIALGFADILIPEANIPALLQKLADHTDNPDTLAGDLYALAEEHSITPEAAPLLAQKVWVDTLFERALDRSSDVTIETALAPGAMALADWAVNAVKKLVHLADSSEDKNQRELATTLKEMCPTSLAVSLAQIQRTRALSLELEEVFADDERILGRMFLRNDFVEGVRALVIDKDQQPKWQPARIEDLDATEVARILDPRN